MLSLTTQSATSYKMRQYGIVFGILFILSVIDFAFAAPVLVQEKRQACVGAVHISHDVIIALGKRGAGEMEVVIGDLLGTGEKPAESSDAHAPSSSALPEPKYEPMDNVQAPASNSASSTLANPDPLMDPLNPSESPVTYFISGEHGESPTQSDIDWMYESEIDTESDTDSNSGSLEPTPSPTSDHEFTGAHELQATPRPLTGPDPNKEIDWDFWTNYRSPPRQTPTWPNEFGQAHENQVENVQHPNLGLGLSVNPDFYRDYPTNLEDQPPHKRPKLGSSEEFSQAHEDQVVHAQQLDSDPLIYPGLDDWFGVKGLPPLVPQPELSSSKVFYSWKAHEDQMVHAQQLSPGLNPGSSSAEPSIQGPPTVPGYGSPEELDKEVVQSLPPNPDSTNPELHSEDQADQALITDSPPSDPAAITAARIYALKGKAKELRRVPGTARDVGNAA